MKFAATAIVLFAGFCSATAQNPIGNSFTLTSGTGRATLRASAVTGDHVYELPAGGGSLLTSASAWALGGQNLLPGGSGLLGSNDEVNLQLVTNGTPRVVLVGTAGANQGFVGINEASPVARLHVHDDISLATPGFASATRIAALLDAGPVDNSVIGGAVYGSLNIEGSNNLGGGIFLFGIGGQINVNYTAANGRLADMAGVVGNVTFSNGGQSMPEARAVTGVFGNVNLYSNAIAEQVDGVRASITGDGATIQRAAVLLVDQPYFTNSTFNNFAGLRINDMSGMAGQATNLHAFRYDGPNQTVIDANGYVGIGMLSPSTSLDVDGGVVIRNDGTYDIDANGTNVPVGNRSFVVIRNQNGGTYGNNTVVTLADGVRNGHVLIVHHAGGEGVIIEASGNLTANADRTYNGNDIGMYVWYNNRWNEMSFANNP